MRGFLLAASLVLTMTATAQHTADQAIRSIFNQQTEAWNRNDAVAFVRDFLDDATFINVRGDFLQGRPAITQIHTFIFSGPYQGSHLAMNVDSITYPEPTVAVVDATADLTQFKALPPGLTPFAPGLLRTRFKFILVQKAEGWKIFAAQNTAIAAQPLHVP